MIHRVAALGLVLVVVACGSGSSVAQGPTPASVAVQPSDLPAGLIRCDLSGDIASFLDKERSADPKTYATVKSDWDSARKAGATAAYTALYTNTAANCALFKSSGANPGAATYKLVVNFVVEFKDAAGAEAGYQTGSFFHFSVADLKSGGAPVMEGTVTGLGPSSIIRNAFLANQTVFVAIWQNQAFLVILAILNVDSTASQKAAAAENSRIR